MCVSKNDQKHFLSMWKYDSLKARMSGKPDQSQTRDALAHSKVLTTASFRPRLVNSKTESFRSTNSGVIFKS